MHPITFTSLHINPPPFLYVVALRFRALAIINPSHYHPLPLIQP